MVPSTARSGPEVANRPTDLGFKGGSQGDISRARVLSVSRTRVGEGARACRRNTIMSNFKKMVEARMAKTGEPLPKPRDRTVLPRQHPLPATQVVRNGGALGRAIGHTFKGGDRASRTCSMRPTPLP
jgi:hypothetical protein